MEGEGAWRLGRRLGEGRLIMEGIGQGRRGRRSYRWLWMDEQEWEREGSESGGIG